MSNNKKDLTPLYPKSSLTVHPCSLRRFNSGRVRSYTRSPPGSGQEKTEGRSELVCGTGSRGTAVVSHTPDLVSLILPEKFVCVDSVVGRSDRNVHNGP